MCWGVGEMRGEVWGCGERCWGLGGGEGRFREV